MRFVDTRSGENLPIDSFAAILAGKISKGLITPVDLPQPFPEGKIANFINLSFSELATAVIGHFFSDIPPEKIAEFTARAYSAENFDRADVLPIYDYGDGIFSIEQWHGKTAAFKDIPLSILPYFMQEALKRESAKSGENLRILLLGATSGDTGSAGEAGFANVPEALVSVLFPEIGKVTYVQKRQMIDFQTTDGRIATYSVLDNFDFCQNQIVKPLLEDAEFRRELREQYGVILSSLNSINIGRIAPQIVSSFQIYRQLVAKVGHKPFDICVPTGNFGHILSAYFAKMMGVPIRKFIVATNENDVLHRFVQTGLYKPGVFRATNSPSMDIAVSGNLERLLFYFAGAEKVRKWLGDLKERGEYQIDHDTHRRLREFLDSGTTTESETLGQIKETWEKNKRLLDPHSAVAMHIAKNKQEAGVPMVFCETAHWGKFVETIFSALGLPTERRKGEDWGVDAIREIDALIQAENGTPQSTRFLQNLGEAVKKPRQSGFRPSAEEMKALLRKQIEGLTPK